MLVEIVKKSSRLLTHSSKIIGYLVDRIDIGILYNDLLW